jgi:uncharacterized repeat protein (TIGR03806 family)
MRSLLIALALLTAACSKAPPVVVHPADKPPERLSDWGIVTSDSSHLVLNDRVVPYTLNTPLFTDYALKLRTVWLPEGTQAKYNETRELDFPVGTIISKTFHFEKAVTWDTAIHDVIKADREATLDSAGRLDLDKHALMETRLLVRYEAGWRALPYVWNEAQDEAYLELAGDVRKISLTDDTGSDEIVYVVPDANQCGGCHKPNHTAQEMRPLGPRAWQLNRDYSYADGKANQLEHWVKAGLLDQAPESAPAGANWQEPGDASLEERAKAYLDANCAHCHNSKGPADTSALDLSIGANVDRGYGICKPPVAVGRGSGDRPYDIYPGRPDDSILVYRMEHSDPAIAMPELGRSTVHAEGTALMRKWISAMPGEC